MENRKIILDGVSYNGFTDEELEDFKNTKKEKRLQTYRV